MKKIVLSVVTPKGEVRITFRRTPEGVATVAVGGPHEVREFVKEVK